MRVNIVRILLCFSIGLTVLCLVLIYLAKKQKDEDLGEVIHTHDVIENVVSLLSIVQDGENGQRGYILTGNEKFLLPYLKSVSKIDGQLRMVKTLTSDNPIQQKYLLKLENEIAYRYKLLDTTVKLKQANKADDAIEIIKSGKGRISMDSIRSVIHRVLSEEDNLLIKRNKRLDSSILFSSLVSYLSLFFIGCMSVISLVVISRKQKINRNLIRDLSSYNSNLESQIKERTVDLEKINQKLVALNEDKNQFLGMAAHDLKNPINTIKGLVNILHITGANNLTTEQKEILDHVTSSTSKMSKLISDLLDVNRIDQGMTDIQFEKENVLEIVQAVVLGFKEMAQSKGIRLVIQNSLERITLSTDRNALSRVMENLISNAIKFSSKGKEITVKLYNEHGKTYIAVQDDGPGIKEEEKHLLFGKFKKLSNRPTEGESSTGLGLSIVKSLVESMNGTIEFTSEVNKGTTFTLIFKS